MHFTAICSGTSEVADGSSTGKLRSECAQRTACSWVPEDCGWIAHVAQMHRMRLRKHPAVNATRIQPEEWLWMLGDGV